MSSPRLGWSLPDAVRLAEQGHSLEQVERMTGYAATHANAQLARVCDGLQPVCGRVWIAAAGVSTATDPDLPGEER